MYYRVLEDNARYGERWFLSEPYDGKNKEIDPREFTNCALYQGATPSYVQVSQAGQKVKFNLAAFDMPVVSHDVEQLLSQLAPDLIQMLPVKVRGAKESYAIANVLSSCACLDEARSEVMKWQPEDGRPEKTGQYRMITRMVIDPLRTKGLQIFRMEGWRISLIVSDAVKTALERVPQLGIRFASLIPTN